MDILAEQIRKLIYTVICFQCLLQLTEKNAYQKYIKLFSYLLTMYICCSVVLGFAGQLKKSFDNADTLYSEWEKEWYKITEAQEIYSGSEYYEQSLWEKEIVGKAKSEYDMQKEEEDVEK